MIYEWPQVEAPPVKRRPSLLIRVAIVLLVFAVIGSVTGMLIGLPKVLSGETKTRAPALPAATDRRSGVVVIEADLFDGTAGGTGIVIDERGLILTAYHVVEAASSVSVEADDGRIFDVGLLGYNFERDIALLKVADDVSNLNRVRIDHDGTAKGDDVWAVGNGDALGYLQESNGKVFSLEDHSWVMSDDGSPDVYVPNLIGVDFTVLSGYSGGPIFDADNEVVGIIIVGSDGPDGTSNAVPIAEAMEIAANIVSGQDAEGLVRSNTASIGALTVYTREDPDDSSPISSTRADGIEVLAFYGDSAAKKAGINIHDVITGIDGDRIRWPSELAAHLRGRAPGESAVLQVARADGRTEKVTVTLGPRELF